MPIIDGKRVRYLGVGAYISENENGGYIVTTGHPKQAKNRVFLGHTEMRALIGFVAEVEKANESPEKTPQNQGG